MRRRSDRICFFSSTQSYFLSAQVTAARLDQKRTKNRSAREQRPEGSRFRRSSSSCTSAFAMECRGASWIQGEKDRRLTRTDASTAGPGGSKGAAPKAPTPASPAARGYAQHGSSTAGSKVRAADSIGRTTCEGPRVRVLAVLAVTYKEKLRSRWFSVDDLHANFIKS